MNNLHSEVLNDTLKAAETKTAEISIWDRHFYHCSPVTTGLQPDDNGIIWLTDDPSIARCKTPAANCCIRCASLVCDDHFLPYYEICQHCADH